MLSPNHVLHQCFEKNGLQYECAISPLLPLDAYFNNTPRFNVLLKTPTNMSDIGFLLFPSGDSHWMPDQRRLVDPWLADVIGRIIMENF